MSLDQRPVCCVNTRHIRLQERLMLALPLSELVESGSQSFKPHSAAPITMHDIRPDESRALAVRGTIPRTSNCFLSFFLHASQGRQPSPRVSVHQILEGRACSGFLCRVFCRVPFWVHSARRLGEVVLEGFQSSDNVRASVNSKNSPLTLF